MSIPVTNSLGTLTAQVVHDICAFVLLEDSGLSLQITTQQFLDTLQLVWLDWLERTELAIAVHSQQGDFAVGQYIVPDEIIRPVLVLYDGLFLPRAEERSIDHARGNWQMQIGEPQVWHEDGLPDKTIEIVDAPRFQGAALLAAFGDFFAGQGAVSVVGPERPTAITMTLSTPLTLIPDMFVPYLAYGVLAKVFSGDGELKDEARAQYCRARFEEGTMLATAIAGNDLEEEEAYGA